MVLFSLFLLIGLYACSNDAGTEGSEDQADYEMAEEKEGFAQANNSQSREQSTEESADEEVATDEDANLGESQQMVIYTGHLDVRVNSFDNMTERVKEQLNEMNGYIVESSEHTRGEDELRSGYMVVRVPQEHFDSFMTGLETEDTKIVSRDQQSQDVTEEYVDLESRLKAKEAVEDRLLQFMEGAEKTEDLLKISDDLSRVQEEIEQIKGRMNYIENHVAYSTVHINIEERNVKVPDVQSKDDLNTFAKAQKLFMDTINFLLTIASNILVLIVGLSPVLIPLLLVGGLVFIKMRRKKQD